MYSNLHWKLVTCLNDGFLSLFLFSWVIWNNKSMSMSTTQSYKQPHTLVVRAGKSFAQQLWLQQNGLQYCQSTRCVCSRTNQLGCNSANNRCLRAVKRPSYFKFVARTKTRLLNINGITTKQNHAAWLFRQQEHYNKYAFCYALRMITVVIETFARCQLYRLLWPWYLLQEHYKPNIPIKVTATQRVTNQPPKTKLHTRNLDGLT